MENQNEARKPNHESTKDGNDKTLVSEAEAAAAKEEPMGSIAAAVPGDDNAAEKGIEPGQKPGAEDSAIRKQSGSTAGTEFPTAENSFPDKTNPA